MTENEIAKIVIDAAIKVHRALEPGLLESVCKIVLAHKLAKRGLKVERQVPISIEYNGLNFQVKDGISRVVNGSGPMLL